MSKQPNILLITTDQQRWDTLHNAGNPDIITPNLDWLCDQGIRFTQAYSECPVCMPARSTLLTGQHAWSMNLTTNTHGMDPIDPAKTLPARLTQAGYQTRLVGKTHFPTFRRNYGFEHILCTDDYYREMKQHPEYGVPMEHGLGQNQLEPAFASVEERHTLTHWTVRRSIDFLETRDENRPFFLWTSFTKPHPPLDPVKSYWDLYEGMELPEPVTGDWSAQPEDVPDGFIGFIRSLNNCDRFSPEDIQRMRRAYYACITQIDYNLGLMISRLRELGELENTWILFTSDHGELLGDHFLSAKFLALEGSAHVPMLIRPPAHSDWAEHRGTTEDMLVTLSDVPVTLGNFAGVNMEGVDGRSIAGMLSGTCPQREEILFSQSQFHGLYRDGWKYLYAQKTGDELLFYIPEDPMEQADRSQQNPDQLKAMRERVVTELGIQVTEPGEGPFRKIRGEWPGHQSVGEANDTRH